MLLNSMGHLKRKLKWYSKIEHEHHDYDININLYHYF